MDTECDDQVQTVLNIVRFPDPPNRPSNRHRIDDQSNPLTIFKIFSASWTPNLMSALALLAGGLTLAHFMRFYRLSFRGVEWNTEWIVMKFSLKLPNIVTEN